MKVYSESTLEEIELCLELVGTLINVRKSHNGSLEVSLNGSFHIYQGPGCYV